MTEELTENTIIAENMEEIDDTRECEPLIGAHEIIYNQFIGEKILF